MWDCCLVKVYFVNHSKELVFFVRKKREIQPLHVQPKQEKNKKNIRV